MMVRRKFNVVVESGQAVKICILGAGALGRTIGGVLTEAGNDVWLINRNADQVNAMNSKGSRLRSENAQGVLVDRTVKVQAATTAHGAGVVDLGVVLVKSFHTAEAMSASLSLLGPGTVVMSLQAVISINTMGTIWDKLLINLATGRCPWCARRFDWRPGLDQADGVLSSAAVPRGTLRVLTPP